MEQWRTFFKKSGSDLWTVIHQAIMIAATDYPEQFKERRCDIAEALFARAHSHGDIDATRLSGSVVTNCTLRIENDEPSNGRQFHADEPSNGRQFHADEPSNGPSNGRRFRADESGNGRRFHADEPSNGRWCAKESVKESAIDAPPPNNDVSLQSSSSIMFAVQDIKATLGDASQSDATIFEALQSLESLHFSVDVLKATEIGKQVNYFRKHSCKEIRALAKGLVRRWKELVDNWVSSTANISSDLRGDSSANATSGGDFADGQPSSASYDEMSRLPSAEEPRLGYYGIKSGSRLVEFPEERGSTSRADISGIDRLPECEKKSQLSGNGGSSETSIFFHNSGHLSSAKNSICGSGPGRPVTDLPEGRPNGNFGVRKSSNEVSTMHQGDKLSHNNRNLKLQILNVRSTCPPEVKLATAKRKLQEGHFHTENVKKQMASQMDLADLPKRTLF